MSYADFIIFKEHKFLRNIFSSDELAKTDSLKDLKTSHEQFLRSLKIAGFFYKMLLIPAMNFISVSMMIYLIFAKIILQIVMISSNFELRTSNVKIKNNKSRCKIPKFTQQIYAFVYQRLLDFPQGRFDYETLTTKNFLEDIYKIINVKINLHDSQVTGKIYCYAHDFCNMKMREN